MRATSQNWLQVGLYFASIAVCAFGSTLASQLLLGKHQPGLVWPLKCLLIMCSVVLTTCYFIRKSGQRWSAYGVRASTPTLSCAVWGLAGGVLVSLLWVVVVHLNLHFRLERNPEFSFLSLLLAAAATVGIGVGEEVGYRSYGMQRVCTLAGPIACVLIPTAIFVFVHVAGGVPLLAGILVVGSSSVLYGMLMMAFRNLPLVAAFHIGNNFVQDTFLRTSSASLLRPRFTETLHSQGTDIRIWIGMACVNVAFAFALFYLRNRAKGHPTLADPNSPEYLGRR